MARVKNRQIELEELVFRSFDHGNDLKETIKYVQERMRADKFEIEELYQDLLDEF